MNVARAEASTTWLSGTFLVDAHVHCHAGVPAEAFLDHAARNFAAGAAALGLAPAAAWLLFTEMAADHAFDALAERPSVGGWRIRRTAEPVTLVAEGPAAFPILLVAGRQIVTREGLEVLAIGTRGPFADGLDLAATIAAVKAADGLAILPWGFGKWWGRRGRILAEALDRATPGTLFLGDNAGRPALASPPAVFAAARAKSIPVLPGSDPLPLAAEAVDSAGRYGFVLEAVVDGDRPAAGLKERLLALREQPRSFGRRQSLLPFVHRQVAMQLRKRKGGR
jgi:hypothetical protein